MVIYQSATTTFQGTWGPEQHASLAAVRAVETGRPVVHATLSGTSAAFDAGGREFARLPQGAGTTTFTLPRATVTTPYDVLGDWVLAAAFLTLVGAALTMSLARAAVGRAEETAPADAAPDDEAPAVTSRG